MNHKHNELNLIFESLDKMILYRRIFDIKMNELFEEPSTYEDELEDL